MGMLLAIIDYEALHALREQGFEVKLVKEFTESELREELTLIEYLANGRLICTVRDILDSLER